MKKENYSDLYRTVCESIEAYATKKLERPLSQDEKSGIWNAGSLMMLEIVERDITRAENAEAVESQLVNDARTFKDRFERSVESLIEFLEPLLSRRVSESERDALARLPNIYELLVVGERIKDTEQTRREGLIRKSLS